MAAKKEKTVKTPKVDKHAEARALITKKQYSVEEAGELLPKLSTSKFVGSANLDIVLSLKEKHANESIRGSIVFPNQFGGEKKVLVFAEGAQADEAKKAGADFVGMDDLVAKVTEGWMDFDVVIATPAAMPKIARLGKVLGPRQLMPNPKTGTVTANVENAVKMYKSGKMDFKMDAGKTIKLRFAKLDMSPEQITANLRTALDAVKGETKRFGLGVLRKILVSPTMGPGFEVKA